MTRSLNSANESAYGAANFTEGMFVYLDFASGILRLHTGVGTIPWGGNDWTGVGRLGEITLIEEGVEVRPMRIKLTLSGVDSSLVTAVMDEDYHGRDAKIYRGTYNSDMQLNANPDLVWSGFMDHVGITTGEGTAIIELVCENALARFDVPRNQRYENSSQQARFSGDLFFEYIPQMAEYEATWGGKRLKPLRLPSSETGGPRTTNGPRVYEDPR